MNLLRNARFFATIVEEEHFGAAADRLGMTQPPLSQGLRRLETELGVRLLDRGPRGVSTTEAGDALLPLVHRLLDAETDLRDAARPLAEHRASSRVAVASEAPRQVVAALAFAASAAAEEPVHVEADASGAIVESILRHRVDVGVVVHPTVTDGLEGGAVVSLPTWLLVPASRRPTDPSARWVRTLRLPLAVSLRGAPAARQLVDDTLLRLGSTSGTVDVADEHAALAAVASGRMCAITADADLTAPGVERVALDGDPFPLRLRLVHRRGLDAEATRVVDAVAAELTAQAGAHGR